MPGVVFPGSFPTLRRSEPVRHAADPLGGLLFHAQEPPKRYPRDLAKRLPRMLFQVGQNGRVSIRVNFDMPGDSDRRPFFRSRHFIALVCL